MATDEFAGGKLPDLKMLIPHNAQYTLCRNKYWSAVVAKDDTWLLRSAELLQEKVSYHQWAPKPTAGWNLGKARSDQWQNGVLRFNTHSPKHEDLKTHIAARVRYANQCHP